MRIEFDSEKLIDELRKSTEYLTKDMKRVAETKFTDELLIHAAPNIEVLLKSATMLPTKGGLKQFYDEQSDIAKANKGWRIPKNTEDPHLLQMWDVDWEKSSRDGVGKLLVSNRKQVKGRESYFSLFEILWYGTDVYVAPVQLSDEERTRLKRQRDKTGQPLYNRWNRDKERWFMEVSKGKAIRGRPLNKRTMQDVGGIDYSPKPKSQVKIWEEVHKMETYGKDSFWNKRESMDIDERRRTEGVHSARQGKNLTPTMTTKYIKRVYMAANPPQTITTKSGIKKHLGKYGSKFPYLHAELHDIGGDDKSYHQGLAHHMHFYNRFKGRFYYNQLVRKGVEEDIVQDFHEYITRCLYEGFKIAVGEITEERLAEIYEESRQ
jgi:hypothetical protein